ncbi:hypothetical protein [Mangrovicoccus algicola]|uniref:Uncharacterized protein n=1 Tax=Mangrovicoccus algicola TaxID=2771008 RepID=A0A8J6YWR9_9RHOB|nr:hypothetical protein [Mangrovicoccus algicola]MBE3637463.1 hypothetical protein [Mangrovicoccus algicola]
MAGLPLAEFGHRTLAELHLVLIASLRREEGRAKARAGQIHTLASLIAIGHHQPKKFPRRRDFLGEARRGSSNAEIKAFFLHRMQQQKRS